MLIASVPIACFSDIYMINAFIPRSSMTALLFCRNNISSSMTSCWRRLYAGILQWPRLLIPRPCQRCWNTIRASAKPSLRNSSRLNSMPYVSFLLLWNLSAYQHFQFKKLLRHIYQWLLPVVYFSPSNSILKCWKNFFDIISWLSILSLILFFLSLICFLCRYWTWYHRQ